MTAQATAAGTSSIDVAPIIELFDRAGFLTIYDDGGRALAGRRQR